MAANKEAWVIIAANLAAASVNAEWAGIEWAMMMLRLALLQRLPMVARAELLGYNSRCGMLVARTQIGTVRRVFEVHRLTSIQLNNAMPVIRLALTQAGAISTAAALGEFTEAVGAIQQHTEDFLERLGRDAGMAGEGSRAWESRCLELAAQMYPAFDRLMDAAAPNAP
jgi:hypothetical protein